MTAETTEPTEEHKMDSEHSVFETVRRGEPLRPGGPRTSTQEKGPTKGSAAQLMSELGRKPLRRTNVQHDRAERQGEDPAHLVQLQ